MFRSDFGKQSSHALKKQSTDCNKSVVDEPTTTSTVRAMNNNQTLPLRPCMFQIEVTFQLCRTWTRFAAHGKIRILLYDNLLWPHRHIFVCDAHTWACVVRKYMRVCLAYYCVERTHEKKMDTYVEKTHRAEKIASIRGEKAHVHGVIVFKQMADHKIHPCSTIDKEKGVAWEKLLSCWWQVKHEKSNELISGHENNRQNLINQNNNTHEKITRFWLAESSAVQV